MPPKIKISKSDIVSAAINIVRKSGAEALNARAIAAELNCSTQPIFSNYGSMYEIKEEVINSAYELYQEYLKEDMQSGRYPVYKAGGMAYIRFAKEEKELFKLLFMRDRTNENKKTDEQWQVFEDIIMKNTGLTRQQASLFHLEMWIYVHGIATMLATSYLPLEWELISSVITDAYQGMKKHYSEEKKEGDAVNE